MLVIEEDSTLSIYLLIDPDKHCCCCFVFSFAGKCLSVKRSYSNKTNQRSTGYYLRNVFLKIETKPHAINTKKRHKA